ncbi:methyltransferase domain-containing protein [Ectothiorhodospiraceae bacterium 2226]|nr:methyltransferase domain-containing protein [Ectothiorhodospiraceae bacterium 2226]
MRWLRISLVLVLSLLLMPAGAVAESPGLAPTGADPAINRPYLDPDFEQWKGRFERPGREVYDHRERILEALALESGAAVADVGAGTGLFTLLFAEAVGEEGRVYAVDISRTFVDNIERRAAAAGHENVIGIIGEQAGVGLDAESVDLVFTSDTYHHFEQPEAMVRAIHAALRPGGEFVLIDFERIEGHSSRWILEHVRAGKETVIEEVEAEGFRLIGEEDFLNENYFLRFEKPAS